MAHTIPKYMGVTSFPYNKAKCLGKLGKHLVGNRFIAGYSVIDIQFCQ